MNHIATSDAEIRKVVGALEKRNNSLLPAIIEQAKLAVPLDKEKNWYRGFIHSLLSSIAITNGVMTAVPDDGINIQLQPIIDTYYVLIQEAAKNI